MYVSDISHCCGNMPGYISGIFHFWSIVSMTSFLWYIQFNKCICNLANEYSFNCGFNFFLIFLTWYILKWYISLITWAIGIFLIHALGPAALGLGHIYQANPSCPSYNLYTHTHTHTHIYIYVKTSMIKT